MREMRPINPPAMTDWVLIPGENDTDEMVMKMMLHHEVICPTNLTHFSLDSRCSVVFNLRRYSFSRLLWHIFPFTVYFFKAAHTQPLTEAEMTKTLYDVCRMTPPSQNLSHTHQNQTFPSKPTICAQLKMYVFSFI